ANIHRGDQNAEDDDRSNVSGTWRATETFADGSSADVLFTFGAGKDANNGTVIHSDELFLTGSPSCLSAQGVWKHTHDREFIATDEGFCFDTFNAFVSAGTIKFKSGLTLNNRGTRFSGTMHIEGFDLDGHL